MALLLFPFFVVIKCLVGPGKYSFDKNKFT